MLQRTIRRTFTSHITKMASETASASSPIIIKGPERVVPVWNPSHELGEGALWHPELKSYLHVDIYGPSKHCKGPAVYLHNPYKDNEFKVFPVTSFCGTVVPRAGKGASNGAGGSASQVEAGENSTRALVALQDGIHSLDLTTGALEKICNPEPRVENRWNDGKCSPEGRFWAGTMGIPGKVLPNVGSLYVMNQDGTTRRAVPDITISNGLAWTADGKTMYYIDTPTALVYAFDYDAATGELSNQRTAFKIPPGTGHPDGCCIDADGNLWVAQWGGWRVVCYKPADGSILAEVHLPAAHVSSCTFGGENLTDLYITTAKEHLTEEDRKAQPNAGDVFLVRDVGFKGVPACFYRG